MPISRENVLKESTWLRQARGVNGARERSGWWWEERERRIKLINHPSWTRDVHGPSAADGGVSNGLVNFLEVSSPSFRILHARPPLAFLATILPVGLSHGAGIYESNLIGVEVCPVQYLWFWVKSVPAVIFRFSLHPIAII